MVRQQVFLGFGDLPKTALGGLPDRPDLLFPLQTETGQKIVDGPGDMRGGGTEGKDFALRDDGFRHRLQRCLRGKDEALTKVDEGGHVQEEERREDRLRQERQAGTRVRNVRLQGPFPGERPAHHRRPSLEPVCGIAAIPELPACTEQGVSFRIDDPAKDSSAPEVPEVPVDVREGNRPDDVVRILSRSAVDEDRKRENASAARKIPGRADEYR